jgi:hypothetical protein
VKEELMA